MAKSINSSNSRRLLLAVALASFAASTTHAEIKYWDTGDGNWGDASNWDEGVPGADDRAYFSVTTGSPQSEIDVNVEAGQSYDLLQLLVFQGKTVNLNMGAGSSLNSPSIIGIGTILQNTPPSSTAGALYINGPDSGTATLNFGLGLQVGANVNNIAGTTLSLNGPGLTVNSNNVTVGRNADGNRFIVSGGATLNSAAFIVSGTTNVTSGVGNNNEALITGAGTSVVADGANGLGLIVASRPTPGLTSSVQQFGNTVAINDGASFTILGNSSNTQQLLIGAGLYRHSNSVTVEGDGSVLELVRGTGEVGTTIGALNTASWNNSLTVRDGALIRTEGETNILTTRTNPDDKNRLVIGEGGTYQTNSNITVNGGLIQLEDGGILLAQNLNGTTAGIDLNISANNGLFGRFEAAGSGLDEAVTVNIDANGVLAIGLHQATEASIFDLNSEVNMFDGSFLEFTIFGANSADTLNFGAGSQLNLAPGIFGDGVTLSILVEDSYTLAAGNSYQLFTGATGNIAGEFSDFALPTLTDGLEWDLSAFNQAGNWTVSIIPEPGTYALIFGGVIGLLVIFRHRKVKSVR